MILSDEEKKWAKNWEDTCSKLPQFYNIHCAKCNRLINFNPYNGDSYRGCWCDRWWCCEEHAQQDGWKFHGDAYEIDEVSCNYCRKKPEKPEAPKQ